MSLNRDQIQALFEAPTAMQPQWAPRGRHLAYTVGIPDVAANATTSEIWVVDAESLQSERLCEGISGGSPPVSWSPDGARLAYVESGDETDCIVIVGLDGSRSEIDLTLAGHGRLALHAFFRTFAWSPTGHRILYTAYNKSPEVPADPAVNPRNDGDGLGEVERIRLWACDLHGDDPPRALTSDGFHSGAGVWMLDGESIAFVSNRSGREEGAVLQPHAAVWSLARRCCRNLRTPAGVWRQRGYRASSFTRRGTHRIPGRAHHGSALGQHGTRHGRPRR